MNLRLTKKSAIFQSPTCCVFVTICINQANQFWGLKRLKLFFRYICKLLVPASPIAGQPEPEPNRERALKFHAQFRFLFLGQKYSSDYSARVLQKTANVYERLCQGPSYANFGLKRLDFLKRSFFSLAGQVIVFTSIFFFVSFLQFFSLFFVF